MKKIYIKPSAIVVAYAFECIMEENSGVGDDPFAKENNFTFDTDDPYELWGDDSSDEDWLNDNNN